MSTAEEKLKFKLLCASVSDKKKHYFSPFLNSIKLGLMEDASNRSRLSKLLRFQSSANKDLTSLEEYVERMKPKQTHIYWLAGSSRAEAESSPFVERLLARGYEVLYMVEPVDEYAISSLPEFDGKKFQNIAKEGFTLDDSEEAKAKMEELKKSYESLTKWLGDVALKDRISKAVVSERLRDSPCALVANMFGWTGNMERLAMSNAHQKTDDPMRQYHLNQKKTLEINPRHPLMKGTNPSPETPMFLTNSRSVCITFFFIQNCCVVLTTMKPKKPRNWH